MQPKILGGLRVTENTALSTRHVVSPADNYCKPFNQSETGPHDDLLVLSSPLPADSAPIGDDSLSSTSKKTVTFADNSDSQFRLVTLHTHQYSARNTRVLKQIKPRPLKRHWKSVASHKSLSIGLAVIATRKPVTTRHCFKCCSHKAKSKPHTRATECDDVFCEISLQVFKHCVPLAYTRQST